MFLSPDLPRNIKNSIRESSLPGVCVMSCPTPHLPPGRLFIVLRRACVNICSFFNAKNQAKYDKIMGTGYRARYARLSLDKRLHMTPIAGFMLPRNGAT